LEPTGELAGVLYMREQIAPSPAWTEGMTTWVPVAHIPGLGRPPLPRTTAPEGEWYVRAQLASSYLGWLCSALFNTRVAGAKGVALVIAMLPLTAALILLYWGHS
jgi:hypothetical protein